MEIRINNKVAALKTGTSFEYVSENRLFTGSDGYSLTITFPLRGCQQNIAIFGNVNRADVIAKKVIFDCEIRDGTFLKSGSITITEINEVEVKTQFLEGRSEQNFNQTFADVYINELDLGAPPTTSKRSVSTTDAWFPAYTQYKCVALPWVNDYSGNIQNNADFDSTGGGSYVWNSKTSGLSWQPYLAYITKKICEAIGYSYDFTRWDEDEKYSNLLICNTLPYAWNMPEFANALPHWTVEEYFEKLELFLGGEFEFDHRGKSITFEFTNNILNAKEEVALNKVIEEHTTEVKLDEESSSYLGSKNLAYKDCDHRMWKYYSCDWFIKAWQNSVVKYDRLKDLIADNKQYKTWYGTHSRYSNVDKLLYAADCDAYFIIQPVSREETNTRSEDGRGVYKYEYICQLKPVNLFGASLVDEEASTDEIEFVPAWLDDTDDEHGRILFLSFSGYDDSSNINTNSNESFPFLQTQSQAVLEKGEKEKTTEYYDRIYIAWFDGSTYASEWGKLPRPEVENIYIYPDWSGYLYSHFSLRINTKSSFHTGVDVKYRINPQLKTTFKFLSNTIPDVRSLFIIDGKRYICEKLTATFTEQGMSQLIKGVFYPVPEE